MWRHGTRTYDITDYVKQTFVNVKIIKNYVEKFIVVDKIRYSMKLYSCY